MSGLTAKQRSMLEVLTEEPARGGHHRGYDAAELARRTDTSENGAARTASSLIRRGLAERFLGGVGRRRVHWYAVVA